MKVPFYAVVLGFALSSTPAWAESSKFEYSANFAMVSKYMWRGWNLNDNLSGQGGFDVGYNGFTGGIWGGTDENQGTEYDLYIGYGNKITDTISFDVGYIQYRYPENDLHVKEWHLTLDFDLLSATYHKGEDDYDYVELNSDIGLTDQLSLGLHYGFEDTGQNNWQDYQVSLNYQINDHYAFYVAGADKEDHDSNVWFGLTGTF